MSRPIIAVDFDGVLHCRPSSEKGNLEISGEAIPGAMNFLRHLTSAFSVTIFSARFAGSEEVRAKRRVYRWLVEEMIKDSDAAKQRGKPEYDAQAIADQLYFSATKPMCRVFLDDRAVTFVGTFPSIKELLEFKTWENK